MLQILVQRMKHCLSTHNHHNNEHRCMPPFKCRPHMGKKQWEILVGIWRKEMHAQCRTIISAGILLDVGIANNSQCIREKLALENLTAAHLSSHENFCNEHISKQNLSWMCVSFFLAPWLWDITPQWSLEKDCLNTPRNISMYSWVYYHTF